MKQALDPNELALVIAGTLAEDTGTTNPLAVVTAVSRITTYLSRHGIELKETDKTMLDSETEMSGRRVSLTTEGRSRFERLTQVA